MTISARRRFVRALFGNAPRVIICALLSGGCSSVNDWVHNGFKVGPNFTDPPKAVFTEWIDSDDARVSCKVFDNDAWWGVFHDPALDALIETAYRENLDLKTAATRVFQSKAKKNVATGNLFPQSQNAIGDYAHAQLGQNINPVGIPGVGLPNTLDVWATGFNISWELDFWGRLRRSVESSEADLKRPT